MKKYKECEGGCSHTWREHAVFDAGLAAAEEDADAINPYSFGDNALFEAWESGASVGRINACSSPPSPRPLQDLAQ